MYEFSRDIRTDLTEYSDRELSLHVMNDEYLYSTAIRVGKDELRSLLNEIYFYTDAQWEDLSECIDEEVSDSVFVFNDR